MITETSKELEIEKYIFFSLFGDCTSGICGGGLRPLIGHDSHRGVSSCRSNINSVIHFLRMYLPI